MKKKFMFCFILIQTLIFSNDSSFLKRNEVREYLNNLINELSIDQKIGQLFFTIVYGDKLDENSKEFLKKTKLGNVVLFNWSNTLNEKNEIKKLTANIKKIVLEQTKLLPFIAVDQEGGKVARLKNGFMKFPSNREIVKNYDEDYAYDMGKVIGFELKDVGINVNFAPVVDVCLDKSFWIASRTYSSDPNVVIDYAKAFINGIHSNDDVFTTLKHFPGHGNVSSDSHKDVPVNKNDLDFLINCDLKPFISLRNKTDFIMTAHLLFPSFDKENIATFSSIILQDLLRNKIGYNKIIISDSLVMKGATETHSSIEECITSLTRSTIKAFNAGCDMMILSKFEWGEINFSEKEDLYIIEKVIENFKKAYLQGLISEKRLNESLYRILKLKIKFS